MFVLTDGAVEDKSKVINLVAKHKALWRVFTVGIGGGVEYVYPFYLPLFTFCCSKQLVTQMAEAGSGECVLVQDVQSGMQAKVLRQLKSTLDYTRIVF